MTWVQRRAFVIFLLALMVVLVIWSLSSAARIPSHSVLVLDISGDIEEQRGADVLAAFDGKTPVLHDYVDAIDAARSDSKVAGLVVKIGPLETGWGKLEEIRAHLVQFRSSGKPSICYLGGDGTGNLEYYLATGCKEVWMVPTAPLLVRGMMAEATFLRGTLDKLKIVPDYYHIAEYKTATNELTEKKFTPAHREEVDSLLHGIYNQYLTDVSGARSLARTDFETLVGQGPFSTDEAVKNHLVDRTAYWDQVQEYFKDRGHGWEPVELGRYREHMGDGIGTARIAVIRASGLIVSGESGNSPNGSFIMGGDSVAADLRHARKDPSIKAIVFRIDSGGGSVVASEVIRREVELARDAKTLVVSMSDVAASGGYWIAMPAHKIVADPDTITGSIGVLIGKMNVSGLYAMLGLSTDSIATSDNASLFSAQQNFTPPQKQWIEKTMQETYSAFIHGVANNRHMTAEQVDKIGKGRVWTGAQAKDIGLVDELGGLDRAIAVARDLAHISANQSVHIVNLPEEKNFFQLLLERQAGGSSQAATLQAILRGVGITNEPVQVRVPFDLKIR
ncbi:MAG: signal peptide peptidase SppA [Candidatus Acidiferrales bacterium]|jgi:protease-4